MLIAQSAYPHYVDTDGSPITSGSLYYGTVGANPRTSPVAIYWDAAGTQPAPQPVRTVAGYPVRNGSPANVYIASAYSVALYNAAGELVFYAPDSTDLDPVLPGSVTIDKLDSSTQDLINGALPKSGGTMTGKITLDANPSSDLHAVPRQYLQVVSAQCRTGFLMTASGSDATIAIGAKELLLRDASGNPKLISSASGTINLANAIGQPLAISTGSWSADTWYAVWAWNNGTTTTFTADPSATSPTAPSGYTSGFRMFLGGFRTDGTVNKRPLAFHDDGETCRYVVGTNLSGLPQMASGTAGNISTPTWVSVAWANFAPPWAKSIHVTAHQLATSGSVVMVAPSNAYGAYTSATNPPPQVCAGGSSVETVTTMEHPLESSSIYWASAGASGNGIFCRGWRSSL